MQAIFKAIAADFLAAGKGGAVVTAEDRLAALEAEVAELRAYVPLLARMAFYERYTQETIPQHVQKVEEVFAAMASLLPLTDWPSRWTRSKGSGGLEGEVYPPEYQARHNRAACDARTLRLRLGGAPRLSPVRSADRSGYQVLPPWRYICTAVSA